MYNDSGDIMNKKYNIVTLKEQGFCYGVTRAINLTYDNLDFLPKPIYLLGNLVHNKYVSDYFREKGIIILEGKSRIEMLDMINKGSVIVTAHGVSPAVYRKIEDKKLTLFDTTCPHVLLSMKEIKEYINLGFDVIYIGKDGHPETEAALGISSKVHLVENINDINKIEITNTKVALSNQTTMSLFDIEEIIKRAKDKFSNLVVIKTICHATKNRQKELSDTISSFKGENVLVIVIGDIMSNNTKMLQKRADGFKNATTIKIESVNELDIDFIKYFKNIIVASGASTPLPVVNKVIETLNSLNKSSDN